MEYLNLSISAGKGKLYEKSKTPKEGFVEVTYGEGEKTYHKYVDTAKGVPTYFEEKEIEFSGKKLKFLELTLVDGELATKISVISRNKNGFTDEAKALMSAVNGLDLGEDVTLQVNKKTVTGKNGKEYNNLNVYINYVHKLNEAGKGLSTGFISFSEIPKAVEKEVAGDKVWDFSPQTEYFYAKLKELEERFKNQTTSASTQAPKTTPSAPEAKQPVTATPQQAFDSAKSFAPDNSNNQALPF